MFRYLTAVAALAIIQNQPAFAVKDAHQEWLTQRAHAEKRAEAAKTARVRDCETAQQARSNY